MILPIITEPNPSLHQPSIVVAPDFFATDRLKTLALNMAETIYAKDGVGLAAPQVGENIRLCVIAKNCNDLDKSKDLTLINPAWTKMSIFKAWDEEGCLSVPEMYGQVKRYKKIKVKALDENGQPLEFIAEDFFARVIQHEVDHLDGILFISKAKNLHRALKE